jgi:hypothetical protein
VPTVFQFRDESLLEATEPRDLDLSFSLGHSPPSEEVSELLVAVCGGLLNALPGCLVYKGPNRDRVNIKDRAILAENLDGIVVFRYGGGLRQKRWRHLRETQVLPRRGCFVAVAEAHP